MSISELYRAVGSASAPATSAEKKPAVPPGGKNEFHELLQQSVDGGAPPKERGLTPQAAEKKLNFSQHADTRIRSRAIAWNDDLEKRVVAGLDAAEAKGSRETLILADGIALIANVKSRTVVTAMDRSQLKERIFTNIDSTVLV
jgi:flagellar operon protein